MGFSEQLAAPAFPRHHTIGSSHPRTPLQWVSIVTVYTSTTPSGFQLHVRLALPRSPAAHPKLTLPEKKKNVKFSCPLYSLADFLTARGEIFFGHHQACLFSSFTPFAAVTTTTTITITTITAAATLHDQTRAALPLRPEVTKAVPSVGFPTLRTQLKQHPPPLVLNGTLRFPTVLNGTSTVPQRHLNGTSTEPQQHLNGTSTVPQRYLNGTSTVPQRLVPQRYSMIPRSTSTAHNGIPWYPLVSNCTSTILSRALE